jgi:hypothetical protein
MGTPLHLTLVGRLHTLTPLPRHYDSPCTAEGCGASASHRLFSRATADVRLFCDDHAVAWAGEHGYSVDVVSQMRAS